MTTPNHTRKPDAAHRRALKLLVESPNGCTEAVLLAHGFSVEMLADLIRTRLATVTTERVMACARRIEIARWRITDAGRRVLA